MTAWMLMRGGCGTTTDALRWSLRVCRASAATILALSLLRLDAPLLTSPNAFTSSTFCVYMYVRVLLSLSVCSHRRR